VKIAYVYDVVYPYVIGGVQKRIWEIAVRLAQRGHEVCIFGMKYWDGNSVLKRDGVYLHGVCPPMELFNGERRSVGEAVYFASRVLAPLNRERFDIIDCQNFPYFPCFSVKIASKLRCSNLVITWHEVWDDYWYTYLGKMGMFGKLVERITARLTSRVIAVSEMTRKDLGKIGVNMKMIRVIPNGIDVKAIEAITPADEQSDIMFAGRLIKEKNVDLLIRAVSLAKTELPSVHCIIIGDGPEREALEMLVKELDLSESVKMKGFLQEGNEVLSYMKSSKVFVLPSVREGFGIVALEANACGLPVITAEHPHNAVCELIEHGKNGFLCQLSVEDLARKILAAHGNRGDQSRECARRAQAYDWKNIALMTESFYYESLA
jgi:glycosyltransferase involved in cell wall biosynthesis